MNHATANTTIEPATKTPVSVTSASPCGRAQSTHGEVGRGTPAGDAAPSSSTWMTRPLEVGRARNPRLGGRGGCHVEVSLVGSLRHSKACGRGVLTVAGCDG